MATTTNYGWTTPDDTALVKDGAAAIRSLGTSVDTTTKALNPSTTLGDIEYRSSTANTNTRLAIGSTGNVLTVAGGVPTWAAPAGGGKVLQVVEGSYSTQVDNATTTYQDTNLTATITPSAATSKILVIAKHVGYKSAGNSGSALYIQLLRGATKIDETVTSYTNSSLDNYDEITLLKLDSPSTTSATTYKTQFKNGAAAVQVSVQVSSMPSQIILMEIGA